MIKILNILSEKDKKKLYFLFFFIVVMAVFELVGAVSILPLITVLTNRDIIRENEILTYLYNTLNFNSDDNFILFIGSTSIILIIFSIFVKAITNYAQLRFAYMRESEICGRILKGYLSKPYLWFINQNASNLGKTILSEVGAYINSCLIPLLRLIAQTTISICYILLLFITDINLAFIITSVLVTFFLIMYISSRSFLKNLGVKRINSNHLRFKYISESFSSFKETKLRNMQRFHLDRFSKPAEVFSSAQSIVNIIAVLPRYLLEIITFSVLIIYLIYNVNLGKQFNDILPSISLFVYAGYRLIPSLQQIYASLSKMRFSYATLDDLHKSISDKVQVENNDYQIDFKNTIEIKNLSFSYNNNCKKVLNNINFKINSGDKIAIIGTTGCGKSTLLDVLSGLVPTCDGELLVDGISLNEFNSNSYRRNISYIPQTIFLSDCSIKENIAFGLKQSEIDDSLIYESAKKAQIHDFIVNDLEDGYDSNVGSDGVRLSGGQRQRIGIARCFYYNSRITIFDEATSALDSQTELKIFNEIINNNAENTFLFITHNTSTTVYADMILLLKDGKIINFDTYQNLSLKSPYFNALINE